MYHVLGKTLTSLSTNSLMSYGESFVCFLRYDHLFVGGLLGLISAVLMLGGRYSYVTTSNDPTFVVSFKPFQTAQTRELASMRNASGNDSSQ